MGEFYLQIDFGADTSRSGPLVTDRQQLPVEEIRGRTTKRHSSRSTLDGFQ